MIREEWEGIEVSLYEGMEDVNKGRRNTWINGETSWKKWRGLYDKENRKKTKIMSRMEGEQEKYIFKGKKKIVQNEKYLYVLKYQGRHKRTESESHRRLFLRDDYYYCLVGSVWSMRKLQTPRTSFDRERRQERRYIGWAWDGDERRANDNKREEIKHDRILIAGGKEGEKERTLCLVSLSPWHDYDHWKKKYVALIKPCCRNILSTLKRNDNSA